MFCEIFMWFTVTFCCCFDSFLQSNQQPFLKQQLKPFQFYCWDNLSNEVQCNTLLPSACFETAPPFCCDQMSSEPSCDIQHFRMDGTSYWWINIALTVDWLRRCATSPIVYLLFLTPREYLEEFSLHILELFLHNLRESRPFPCVI